MKITEVRTIAVGSFGPPPPKGVGSVLVRPTSIFYDEQKDRQPGGSPISTLLVHITTDEGITGVGSVGAAWGNARFTIDNHLKYVVLNQNPFDVEVL